MMMNIRKLSVLVALGVFAAAGYAQDLGPVDANLRTQVGAALTNYYAVKDALVDSNVNTASEKAGALVTSLEAIDETKMTEAQKTHWGKVSKLLRTDAVHINRNKDLEHQREHFMKLSNNMYSLVSAFKGNDAEAYLHYCPMKKATWLSASKEVKNPYYGKRMLTCGSVRATLKKS